METTLEIQGNTHLSNNIRFLRRKMSWSQEELAIKIGLNRGNIASYENGTAEPKICNLLKLAFLFCIPIQQLAQKDLSDQKIVNIASSEPITEEAVTAKEVFSEKLIQIQSKAEELEKVMSSLATCSRYKLKNIAEDLPKELQLLVVNFEEMYAASQSLMEEHLSLIEMLQCKEK
jgi:transcriptional regulator with XRE-family HTH domain